jgi:hypothetical protein
MPYLHTVEHQSYKLMECHECWTGVIVGSEALSDLIWTRYGNLLVNVPLYLRLNPKMGINL